MITGPIATIIAAVIAGAVAIFGSMALVYHRLGKLEQAVEDNRELQQAENARLSDKMDADYGRLSDKIDALRAETQAENARLSDKIDALRTEMHSENARLSDKMDAHHSETMREIRRLVDALISHSHDADGSIIFRIPPGSATDRHPQEGEDPEASEDSDSPD